MITPIQSISYTLSMFFIVYCSTIFIPSCGWRYSSWVRDCAEHRPLADCRADALELFK